ncbi:MAG: adenine-specific DNA methylase [Clostridium sp.]|nr:adenine-specific DNA methylase [Clostridium sp.]
MKIERVWAMPNKWTFTIPPIASLLKEELDISKSIWIDPFAGMNSPATITNDLNVERKTNYHMEAIDFLKMFENQSIDGVLFDPPYSPRQVRECYDGINGEIKWDGKTTFWSGLKDEISRILKIGGKAICFGWNSMGCGINRGFEMTRILLVPHGGNRNDTICTVEIKTSDVHIKPRKLF